MSRESRILNDSFAAADRRQRCALRPCAMIEDRDVALPQKCVGTLRKLHRGNVMISSHIGLEKRRDGMGVYHYDASHRDGANVS